jgi:hypothetical protein
MTAELELGPLAERLEHLVRLIGSPRFLQKQGLGNEVPFFICPFPASDAVRMEKLCKQLVNRLGQQGVRVLQINLYDLVREIMTPHGDWDWWLNNEALRTKQAFLDELQRILDAETVVVPEIARRISHSEFDVLFLDGVGEVYPYIRSHNVLNNLQKEAKEKPTVMFFPGQYTHSLEKGASLDLFGRLRDDKYYRAFNIYDCEI